MKVQFFLYHASSLDFSEDIRIYKTRKAFEAALTRLRNNPFYDVVEYNILG